MSSTYDHNDPEVVEAMKFLMLPPEEKIKLQAQPFDGKKACWVPDPKESFVPGEIVSTKGEEVTVKSAKGEVSIQSIFFKNNLYLFFSRLSQSKRMLFNK
jgi:hypothetical protein